MASGFNSARSKRETNSKLNSATAVTEQMYSFLGDRRRLRAATDYLLTDILIIGILSVIAGGMEDMENYGLSKYDWLKEF